MQGKKAHKLTKMVEEILTMFPETRNSDIVLAIKIWTTYFPHLMKKTKNDELGIYLTDLHLLPTQDHIRRLRAVFQNDKKLYLPTEWAVAKQRKMAEAEWRSLLGYAPIKNLY